MSRPPRALERVLDAFEKILAEGGERAATMDATARKAGVSKGGLLYHFASKEALEAGLIERVETLAAEDVAPIRESPEGAVAAFMRTSLLPGPPPDHDIAPVFTLAHTATGPGKASRREREGAN